MKYLGSSNLRQCLFEVEYFVVGVEDKSLEVKKIGRLFLLLL